ncbi:helix-turn-helix domain-containing protein [Brachybacterium massiliense]|uniref:helix-turn-helix domain-containing protein n=1 Tax=Brachybacterium massiliense TaxID=1755098 RepID=UPI000B3BB7D1|nr:helix-turn-helix domain-containing protein [Brachybacterium massiliense]
MANPWTAEDDAKLRALHAEGRTLTSIARELGRSSSTIARHGKAAGLSWSRAKVKAANEARTVDAKARRLAIVEKQLTITELLQASVERGAAGHGWQTILKGDGGAEHTQRLNHVPARDAKDMMSALNSSSTIIARLDDQTGDHDDAKSVLADLIGGLNADYERRNPQ